jgi:hypothetical protein
LLDERRRSIQSDDLAGFADSFGQHWQEDAASATNFEDPFPGLQREQGHAAICDLA